MSYNPISIVPAYGRCYDSFEQLQQDWNAGKDFKLPSGPYLSKRDLSALRARSHTHVVFVWYTSTGDIQQITLSLNDAQVTA